jgi:cyanophycinase
MTGPLALVGGAEWQPGCDFDRDLLDQARSSEVLVVPTGAAYEHPDTLVEAATAWFEELGASVRPVMALDRTGADDPGLAQWARSAGFIYLAGGSALHIRSTLMQTTLWEAVRAAWQGGAVLAGTSAGAMALCDPMVDPRGGALTVGLAMIARRFGLQVGVRHDRPRAARPAASDVSPDGSTKSPAGAARPTLAIIVARSAISASWSRKAWAAR